MLKKKMPPFGADLDSKVCLESLPAPSLSLFNAYVLKQHRASGGQQQQEQ